MTIRLYDEAHEKIVADWTLVDTTIVKQTSGLLDTAGGDVAIEELELSYRSLEAL